MKEKKFQSLMYEHLINCVTAQLTYMPFKESTLIFQKKFSHLLKTADASVIYEMKCERWEQKNLEPSDIITNARL